MLGAGQGVWGHRLALWIPVLGCTSSPWTLPIGRPYLCVEVVGPKWELVATTLWLTLWGNFRVGFMFGNFSLLVLFPVYAFALELPLPAFLTFLCL